MVARIFSFFNQSVNSVHRVAYVLGFFSLFAQFLSLARERIFAHSFGASSTLDIYLVAFKIPDILFITVASLVSLSVVLPFIAEKREKSDQEAREFFNSILSSFLLVSGVVAVVLWVFAPVIVERLFGAESSSFDASELAQVVGLTRLLLLQPIILGISNLFASITQIHKKFLVYAITPILYNLGIIFGVVFLYPLWGVNGLGAGVILGALMHLLIQLPVLLSEGCAPQVRWQTWGENFKNFWQVVRLSLPRTLAMSASQIVLLVFYKIASGIGDGAISVFSYGFNLESVPLAIIGVSYSVAAFPTLARYYAKGDNDRFAEQITRALRHVVFWMTPMAVLFIVLRAQAVRVVLGSGSFNWEDTRLTAAILALFAVSLVAQALVLLFVRGYYAAGKTRRPFVLSLFSTVVSIVLSFALVYLFENVPVWQYFWEVLLRIEDISGTAVVMLPLAYSLGVLLQAGLLWIFFERDFPEFRETINRSTVRTFTGSVAMGVVAYGLLNVFDKAFDIQTFMGIFLQGALSAILALIFWFGLMIAMGSPEVIEIKNVLWRRVRR